ncbi:MAG: SUMF1/EgtB/PvdO family nonheme iron enzyme [Niastella sp.]|nr:SUMF1/EgtB/PvdO family nonheme iron enzyme [Niastella sp.]
MKKVFLFFISLVSITSMAIANDVVVTNVSLINQNTSGPLNTHYSDVQFSISWKNSWRTSTNESNYDGCWLFIKYRKQSTSVWLHATLNISGQVSPAGSVVKPAADGKGAFVYPSANGMGDVNYNNATLRWNYGNDGVLDNEKVEIRVYAVEMVNIPQGAFNLGNASLESYHFKDGASGSWFPVTSENEITCGTASGQLYADYYFTSLPTIPAAYPKGFKSYWIMKYEFSNQQYLDFLNTLDQTSANAINSIGATGSVPNMVITFPERAAVGITPLNSLSWLDWAAMRPMTEFEYEKACRGANNTPSPLEYAWGNTTLTVISGGTNIGANNETWLNGNANYLTGGPYTPMRCGALATATSDRTQSGASFYGVMEMSGNALELTVCANNNGSTFTGNHGDGVLDAQSNANTPTWPSLTNDYSMIIRGGSFASPNFYLQMCNRSGGVLYISYSSVDIGGRGVRTAE